MASIGQKFIQKEADMDVCFDVAEKRLRLKYWQVIYEKIGEDEEEEENEEGKVKQKEEIKEDEGNEEEEREEEKGEKVKE